MSERDLQRVLEAMLADKPAPRVELSADERAVVEAAAQLRAARDDAGVPRTQFIDDLNRRLREAPQRGSRRRFLQGVGIAAAAAAAGVAADRLASATVLSRGTPAAPAGGPLTPDNGVWTAVTTLTALRSTPVVRFSVGSVTGFVISNNGAVSALSAICTHQGCVLHASQDSTALLCPCHNQSFGLNGAPASGDYFLPPLPALQHRISGDSVEVLVAAD